MTTNIIADKKAARTAQEAVQAFDDADRNLTLAKAELETLKVNKDRLAARLNAVREHNPGNTPDASNAALDELIANPDAAAGGNLLTKLGKVLTGDREAVRKHREEAAPLRAATTRAEGQIAALEAKIIDLEGVRSDARITALNCSWQALYAQYEIEAEAMVSNLLEPMFSLSLAKDQECRRWSTNPANENYRETPQLGAIWNPTAFSKLAVRDGRDFKDLFPAREWPDALDRALDTFRQG
ncbi:hypothetical protein ACSMXM_04865 [Pacificimonas sp. ICDLI1SI03]